MRPSAFFIRVPMIAALVVAPAAFAPAFAQNDDEIVFVSGTGDIQNFDSPTPSERADAPEGMMDLADKMADPDMQDGIASAVETMAATMMKLPVGQFAAAIEDARPGTVRKQIRRDATVSDVAGRDAEYLPQELGDRSRDMMGMMGSFAKAFAVMMPEFEKMGREMEASFKAAKAEAKRN